MFFKRKQNNQAVGLDELRKRFPYQEPVFFPGHPLCLDILEQEHVLIAGTTGSGKSVLLNSIIFSGLGQYQWCLIDPKMIDLKKWANTGKCIGYASNAPESLRLLEMMQKELWRRIGKIPQGQTRYTAEQDIVIVIDEMAMLLSYGRRQVIEVLAEIMRLGRAAGMHVIAATQAPNRGKGGGIPAELQQCFTAAVGLRCRSAIESRQIVGVSGCETLPEYGKGLYWSKHGTKKVDIPMTHETYLAELIRRCPRRWPTDWLW